MTSAAVRTGDALDDPARAAQKAPDCPGKNDSGGNPEGMPHEYPTGGPGSLFQRYSTPNHLSVAAKKFVPS
jgi:hypothetical protein